MPEPASAVSVSWTAIQALVAIGVPIIGAIITLIIWFHRRLDELEDMDQQRQGAGQFFGDSDNPLSIGLAREVRDLKNKNEETREDVASLQQEVSQLSEKVDRVYDKLDED